MMIYLDNAATTKLEDCAFEAMLPFLKDEYGNASAVYEIARRSKKAVFNARKQCGKLIGASPSEIFFTSGGTESDNWALIGAYDSYRRKAGADGDANSNLLSSGCGHIITTAIEHHAIIRTAEYLKSCGVSVTFLKPDSEGFISPEQVVSALREDTFLVSVMTANNEIGTIEPVCEIADAVHALRKDILVHTDSVQAFGQIHMDGFAGHVDLLSASAHKLGGPKGCGLLFIRDGLRVAPFIRGGMQESGRRAGTENIPGIVGFGAASEKACLVLDEKIKKEVMLRDELLGRILNMDGVIINGPYEEKDCSKRLPGNISVCVTDIEGESALIMLDREEICASSGSACASGARETSHVLKAIGRSDDESKSSLRFTISEHNTSDEIKRAAEVIADVVCRLRSGRKHL